MGTGQAIALVVGVVVAIAAVGALAAGGLTATTVEVNEPGVVFDLPPADGSYAVVVGTYQTKAGFGLFGLDITPSRWAAQVTFAPPPGCSLPADGKLRAVGACAGVAAEGDNVAVSGTSAEGTVYWNLELDVSKACHKALEIGDRWPTTKQECQ